MTAYAVDENKNKVRIITELLSVSSIPAGGTAERSYGIGTAGEFFKNPEAVTVIASRNYWPANFPITVEAGITQTTVEGAIKYQATVKLHNLGDQTLDSALVHLLLMGEV